MRRSDWLFLVWVTAFIAYAVHLALTPQQHPSRVVFCDLPIPIKH